MAGSETVSWTSSPAASATTMRQPATSPASTVPSPSKSKETVPVTFGSR
ncbi:MAG: hypothetical protein HY721_25630 [Planctomycetes bacterium]|nr:hypothetical protein [Planctomycetota bacterium]